MESFIGRGPELRDLESIYRRDGVRTLAVYGRRRIGKSELLKRFCSGKRTLYIDCVEGSDADRLHTIALALTDFDGRQRDDYRYFEDAFRDIADICREDRTVVVLDEFPFLVGKGDHVPSVVQKFIDVYLKGTDTMFVICGSSVAMMLRETTDYGRPLYGRFGNPRRIDQMPYSDCRLFHPNMSEYDRMRLYLTLGGIPRYHLDRETATYEEYVIRNFLDTTADFGDEATALLSAEFKEKERYIAIVNAICDGKTSHKTICERAGLEKSTCSKCLDALELIGFVGKVNPMLGAPKHPVYRVTDSLVAFCQTVMPKARSTALSSPEGKYERIRQPISTFLGQRFEDLCAEYVRRRYGCDSIGKWWGADDEKVTQEIDVVAVVEEDGVKHCLFGECKFTSKPMGPGVLRELQERAELTNTELTHRYILFSGSGFTEELEEIAQEEGVALVGLDDFRDL